MDLVKVNAEDFGLEESKAKEISKMFKPMLDEMVLLENEFNALKRLPMSEEVMEASKELMKKYVKVRTGTAKVHKEMKSFYLKGGRFVDGWKNAQIMASAGIEDELSKMANYYVNLEKERIASLKEERLSKLKEFGVEYPPASIDTMEEAVWSNYIAGVEQSYLKKQKAEQEAEEEAERVRIETQRLAKIHSQRKEELLNYWDFVSEKDKILNYGSIEPEAWDGYIKLVKGQKEKKAKDDEALRISNAKLEEEAEVLRKENEEREAIIKRNEAQQTLEKDRMNILTQMGLVFNGEEFIYHDVNFHWTEIKTMQDVDFKKSVSGALVRIKDIKVEEERILAEEEAKKLKAEAEIEKKLNEGDAAKMRDLISQLENLKTSFEFKSKRNQKKYEDFAGLTDKVILFLKK